MMEPDSPAWAFIAAPFAIPMLAAATLTVASLVADTQGNTKTSISLDKAAFAAICAAMAYATITVATWLAVMAYWAVFVA